MKIPDCPILNHYNCEWVVHKPLKVFFIFFSFLYKYLQVDFAMVSSTLWVPNNWYESQSVTSQVQVETIALQH